MDFLFTFAMDYTQKHESVEIAWMHRQTCVLLSISIFW